MNHPLPAPDAFARRKSYSERRSMRLNQLCIIPLLASFACLAQPVRPPTIEAMLKELGSTRPFDQVAISPDGKRVAWLEKSTIYVASIGRAAEPVRISAGTAGKLSSSERELAWSPDSARIAF